MNPKGFAFIEFESVGALQAALTAYRGDDERFTFGDMRICLEEKTGQKRKYINKKIFSLSLKSHPLSEGSKSRDGPKGQGQRDRTGKAGGAKVRNLHHLYHLYRTHARANVFSFYTLRVV